MKKIIAKLLLGKTVMSILDKTEKYRSETIDYKTRLKSLLLKRNAINQQKIDLEKREHGIRIQIDSLKIDIEQKRDLRFILDEINQKEDEIRNTKKACDVFISDIANLQSSIDHIQQETNNLNASKTKLESDKKRSEAEIDEKDAVTKELENINSEIINIQKWLEVHSTELTPILGEINKRLQALVIDARPKEPPVNEEPDKGDDEHDKEIEKDQIVEPEDLKKKAEQGTDSNTAEVAKRKKRDRSIEEILDLETGDTIDADEFFNKPMDELEKWRTFFQECISQNKRRFVCPKCYEMIRISGKGDERGVPSFFTHKNDSVYCQRTKTGLSEDEINRRKYALVGQSQRHKILKQQLCDCLNDANSIAQGIQNVETEKRVYSSLPFFNYRQPDVQIDYKGKHIVFEIQLSATFLSVINERDTFYRLNGYYIIWVFNFEDNKKFVDLNNLAMKDIYFANKWNAFIFDEDARQWSRERKQLVLKCNWLDPDLSWHHKNTKERFGGEPVTLDKLKFDADTFKPYFFDAEKLYLNGHPEKAELFIKEQKSREEHIKDLEQQAQDKEARRQETIELVKLQGGKVIAFEEKKKYGFKYGATVIIEPKYTSCEEREDGTFIVGYGPHKGLVNQYGEIVIPCKSTDIRFFEAQLIVYKVKEDKCDYWRIPYFDDYELNFRRTDFWTVERVNSRVIAVRLCSSESDVTETIYCWNESILLNRGYRSWFVYDKYGNKLSNKSYETIDFIDENKAKVTKNDVEGFINSNGDEIPLIEEFPDGYKSANLMGKYCLLNSYGFPLSDYCYDTIDYFSEGKYVFGVFRKKEYSKTGWYGISRTYVDVIKNYYVANRDLCPVTPLFSKIDKPVNGVAYAYSGSGKGYDYESGEMHFLGMVYQLSDQGILIPNETTALSNGNIIAKYGIEWNLHGKQKGKYKYSALLNPEGEKISEFFSEMDDIGNGYIVAKKKINQIGVVKYDGKVFIPFEYEQIKPIDVCGIRLLSVKKDSKYGRIDMNRRIIIPIKFDNISWYKNKPYIIVEHHHIITKEKKYGRRTNYQSFIKKKCGLYHITGNKILDTIYSSITVDDNEVVHFVLNGRKGYLNADGKVIFEQTISIPQGQSIEVSIKSIDVGRKFLLAEADDGKQTFIHWSWLNYGSNLDAYKVGDKLRLVNSGYDKKRERIIWKEVRC